MKTGVEIIAEERERQISQEGWTSEHDDLQIGGQLSTAAACYAAPHIDELISWWPWQRLWRKPSPDNRIKELAKAGALIAAEIDRLNRVNK